MVLDAWILFAKKQKEVTTDKQQLLSAAILYETCFWGSLNVRALLAGVAVFIPAAQESEPMATSPPCAGPNPVIPAPTGTSDGWITARGGSTVGGKPTTGQAVSLRAPRVCSCDRHCGY
jgi:hypothetical protein